MPKTKNTDPPSNNQPTEAAETRVLIDHGFQLAREIGISKVLVYASLVVDQKLVERHREDETLILVTTKEPPKEKEAYEHFIEIPGTDGNRIAQVKIGLIVAVFQGIVEVDESVVCLTGLAGSKRLDNLLIINPKRDFPWFSKNSEDLVPQFVSLKELLQVLTIGLRMSSEGREGKPIGTIFVIGKVDELEPHLKPLILNPLSGHNKKDRSIHDSGFFETIRELSALDGAFVISPKGVVEHAGVYLDAPISKKMNLPRGLGARHMAAASITAKTNSIAIVISESSGKLTVFCQGQEMMTLDGKSSS